MSKGVTSSLSKIFSLFNDKEIGFV
ncbi:hypothetical protein [Bernardetia sp.]